MEHLEKENGKGDKIKMKWFIICIIIACILGYITTNKDLYYTLFPSDKPTLGELKTFIREDQTDKNVYDFNNYVCEDFAEDVIENAKKRNFRVGDVTLKCEGYYDHAIVAFDTTEGIYFLEPQLDYLFSEANMKQMIEDGEYYISVYSGGGYEYFLIDINGYSIAWR